MPYFNAHQRGVFNNSTASPDPVDPINPDQTELTQEQLQDIVYRASLPRRDEQGNVIPFGFPNLGAYQNLRADLANLRGV